MIDKILAKKLMERAKNDGMKFIQIASAAGVTLPTVYACYEGKNANIKIIEYLINFYKRIDSQWVIQTVEDALIGGK